MAREKGTKGSAEDPESEKKKKIENEKILDYIGKRVFNLMFTASGKFLVIPYDSNATLHPQVAQDLGLTEPIESSLKTPDFLIIDKMVGHPMLVEVQFRHSFPKEGFKRIPGEERYPGCRLFLATPNKFIFSRWEKFLASKDWGEPLSHIQIPQKLQDRYLALIHRADLSRADADGLKYVIDTLDDFEKEILSKRV